MKKLQLLLIVTFLVIISASAQAQKKYISYKVKQGETIKSIAKDNELKEKDLLKLNPDVDKKPQANTMIIIPNPHYDRNASFKDEVVVQKISPQEKIDKEKEELKKRIEELQQKQKELETGKSDENLRVTKVKRKPITKKMMVHVDSIHTVKLGDNLYALSKKYNVSLDSIMIKNKLESNELDLNQELIIPMMVEKTVVVQPKGGVKSIKKTYHKVVKGDTFYSLGNKFNISKEELIRMNPQLVEGLKVEQEIVVKEEVEMLPFMQKKQFEDDIDTSREINAYLMLPFKTSKLNDSILINDFNKRSVLNITTDFYLGAIEAVDSLRQQGANIRIKVLDTENSIKEIDSLNESNDLSRADIIIGPFYLKNAGYTANKNKNIPIVAPMFSKKYSNKLFGENLIKAAPKKDGLENTIIEYLLETFDDQNIILIGDSSEKNISKLNQIESKFKSIDSLASIVKLYPKEEKYIKRKDLFDSLDSKRENIIVITSPNKVIINSINNLSTLDLEDVDAKYEEGYEPKEDSKGNIIDTYDIQLFSLLKEMHYNFIDLNLLGKLSFTFPSAEYVNMEDEKVQKFYDNYRVKNFRTPTKYAISGFDITYDILSRLLTDGSIYGSFEEGVSRRIGTKFEYKQKPSKSFENYGNFILQYDPDLNVHILN
ncbi:LysM peptidoglycan-binding domain-containing protein [Aureivirga marina]|uniref:LysM peptidoglycan-binding domain-containing protein n=1 Tax=Aureivirga marina TaxID=1182451 RepID=UPI0018CAFBFC|nr:LysM peptidoglycan-binding domain-containing protein [Aureivirga marina]